VAFTRVAVNHLGVNVCERTVRALVTRINRKELDRWTPWSRKDWVPLGVWEVKPLQGRREVVEE